MKKKFQRYIKIMFVLTIALSSINGYTNSTFAEEAGIGNDDITINVSQKYDEEANVENIEIGVEGKEEGIQVLDVVDSEIDSLQLNEGIYSSTATENGEQEFTVKYLSEDDEQKEYKFTVDTISIKDKDITSEKDNSFNKEVVDKETEPVQQASDTVIEKQPRIDVSEGKVRVEIADYEETAGWDAGVDKVMVVYAQFEATDTEKKLDITLPMGMRYTKYRVLNPSGDLELEAEGTLKNEITKVTSPDKTVGEARYGTLSYEFAEGTENVRIELIVTVDTNTVTKDTTITDGINVSASQNKTQIGLIKKDLNVKRSGVNPYFYAQTSNTVIALKNQESISLPAYGYYPTTSLYHESLEITYYYPPNFKYEKVVNAGNYKNCVVDELAGTVTLTYEKIYLNNPAFYPYIVVSGKDVGEGNYTVETIPKVVATNFQGEQIVQNTTNPDVLRMKPTIEVKESVENKLGIGRANSDFYDVQSDYYTKGPMFTITNDNTTEKTNQVYEVTIDPNYLVAGVNVPYDRAYNSDGIKIYYKTNKNNGKWIEADKSSIKINNVYQWNGFIATITKDSLNLDEDEYITNVKGYIGTVSKGFVISNPLASLQLNSTPSVSGRLKDDIDTASVQVSTYSEEVGDVDENSRNTAIATVARNANSSTTVGRTMLATTLVAGETTNQNITIGTGTFRYGTQSVVNSPTIYLRIPNGITYSNFKVQSYMDGIYKNANYEISEPYVSTISGETFIKIKLNESFGHYFGNNLAIKLLVIDFDVTANIQAESVSYNWSDYAFIQDSVFPSISNATLAPFPIRDTLDVNNDGNTTELITPINSKDYKINSQTGLLIDTFITPKDGERKNPYNGDESTAIAFKPETEATYTIDMFNNTKEDVEEIRGYIPVPKESNNYGKNFQTNVFSWNMKLTGNPTVKVYDVDGNEVTATRKNNYKIEYASDATNESNYVDASYGSTYSDSTSMIRLTNTGTIPNGERVVIEFPYVVNETEETVKADLDKLGTVNDFMPYYYYKSVNSSGYTNGTKVGAILSIGSIEGIVFVDTNANGLYDAGDTLVTGGTVKLFAQDNTTTIPDATASVQYNGTYQFTGLDITSYTLNFSGIPGKFQKFTVSKVGENDDALKDQDSEVTYLGDNTGKVFNVNTALLSSKSVNAGLINYQAPTINSAENLYFAKGDTKTDAQLLSAAGITTTGFFLSDKVVNQKAVSYDTVGGPYSVALSIEDAYGEKSTHTFNVTIVNQITASGFAVSINDLEDADFVELSNAKAYDVSDPAKLKTSTVTLSTKKPTTTGLHDVTFKADNGEKKTVKVLVYSGEVTNNQVINASNFTTTLENLKTADMKDLANAKGYDISNLNDIKEIDVTTVTSKPTKAGKYDITFTTTGGATKTVAGLISEKAPTKKNEVVTASGFQIKLTDVAGADFITLANAKGYDVTDINNILDVEVTMVSEKPTSVGIHTVRFETENGAFSEIEVLVTNNDPTGPDEDGKMEVVVAQGFKISTDEVAGANFITLANAKGYSYSQNDLTNRTEVGVTMVGEKPTTVGIHKVRFETAKGTYTEVDAQVYKHSGGDEEKGKMYANDFSYSLDSGELTADKAKQLAQVSAENVAVADIEVTKADLDTINEAIGNKEVNVIYGLTFTTAKGSSVSVSVTLYENGSSQEDEFIYGNGFKHKIRDGNLTADQVKDLANIVVKKESGAEIPTSEVVVNQSELDAINTAITNKVVSDTTYPLTFTSPKGSQITVQVTISQDQVTIVDDFKEDDGILVIYRTEDTNENLSFKYNLKLQIDGKDITETELSKVTWTVEAVGGFNSEKTYVTINDGSSVLNAKKSGVVKLTANYEGVKSSIYVVVPGDVNRDGSISTRDATNIQKYIRTSVESDIGPMDEFTMFLANMNGDGAEGKEAISTRDSTVIQKMIRQEIKSN